MSDQEAAALGYYTMESKKIKKLAEARDDKLESAAMLINPQKTTSSEYAVLGINFDAIRKAVDEAEKIDRQLRESMKVANEHAKKCGEREYTVY